MGLRIIGRPKKITTELTDTERLLHLEQEADNWVSSRGVGDGSAKGRLLAHYKTARERITSTDDMEEMAKKIRLGIILDSRPDKTPHLKVDIATLLELL